MGVGFAVDCRWAFPPIQPLLPTNPSTRHHHPQQGQFRGRATLFETSRVSSLYLIPEGSETVQSYSLNSYTCSFGVVHKTDKNSAEVEEVNISEKFLNDSQRTFTNFDRSVTREYDFLRFNLLTESLAKIENILDSDLVRLERDILIQIGRLGALKLFHSCLSRTFVASDPRKSPSPLTEHSSGSDIYLQKNGNVANIVVRSRKKEDRKLKRKRASEKTAKILVIPSSSKSEKKVEKFPISSATSLDRESYSGLSRRILIARRESEMSMGVKEVANLERTRLKWEEKVGRTASFAMWAEASGIDKKTLQQRLHFGWYCRDRLLRSTFSLVVYVAKNYTGMGIGFDDLIQAGNMGVLLGTERFDSTRGYRFSTYVQYWIRKSMSAFVAQHSRGIRIPATMEKIIKRIQKAWKSLSCSGGIYPRDDEIADYTGLSLANVRLANKLSRSMGSVDQKLRGGLNIKFSEITPDRSTETPEEVVTKTHMSNDIHKLLKGLHPRERLVLLLRYGLGDGRCKSLAEIGQLVHVSKEWIRKIEKAALEKIRKKEIQEELKHYLKL